jgi:hypothetical protein
MHMSARKNMAERIDMAGVLYDDAIPFPTNMDHAFRPEYDRIKWINNEQQFEAWCKGETGFPW